MTLRELCKERLRDDRSEPEPQLFLEKRKTSEISHLSIQTYISGGKASLSAIPILYTFPKCVAMAIIFR